MFNYFECDESGFTLDKKFNFDPASLLHDNELHNCQFHSLPSRVVGKFDQNRRMIYDSEQLSIRHLPPSLFLVAVTNAYSPGLSTYIPLSMTFETFSKQVSAGFRQDVGSSMSLHSLFIVNHQILDTIKTTGYIDTAMWNKCAGQYVFIHSDGTVAGSIQSIVAKCEEYLVNFPKLQMHAVLIRPDTMLYDGKTAEDRIKTTFGFCKEEKCIFQSKDRMSVLLNLWDMQRLEQYEKILKSEVPDQADAANLRYYFFLVDYEYSQTSNDTILQTLKKSHKLQKLNKSESNKSNNAFIKSILKSLHSLLHTFRFESEVSAHEHVLTHPEIVWKHTPWCDALPLSFSYPAEMSLRDMAYESKVGEPPSFLESGGKAVLRPTTNGDLTVNDYCKKRRGEEDNCFHTVRLANPDRSWDPYKFLCSWKDIVAFGLKDKITFEFVHSPLVDDTCMFARNVSRKRNSEYMQVRPPVGPNKRIDYILQSSTQVLGVYCTRCGLLCNFAYCRTGYCPAYWTSDKAELLCVSCARKEVERTHSRGSVFPCRGRSELQSRMLLHKFE